VSLPNFGDERAHRRHAAGWRGLNVPVLVQGHSRCAGENDHRPPARQLLRKNVRVANNLKQYGIAYSLTTLHTVSPSSAEFKKDLEWFLGRMPSGEREMRKPCGLARLAPRPAAFNTVRYSEKDSRSE